jgi:CBS domain-containing protein
MTDLALEARDVMTEGVVSLGDDAKLADVIDAMAEHRIHAVLVVGARSGTALGWVNTRGLLGFVGADPATPATEAITEPAKSIEPTASLRAAIYALALPGCTRLLVRGRGEEAPVGVITDYDLTVKPARLSRPRG